MARRLVSAVASAVSCNAARAHDATAADAAAARRATRARRTPVAVATGTRSAGTAIGSAARGARSQNREETEESPIIEEKQDTGSTERRLHEA